MRIFSITIILIAFVLVVKLIRWIRDRLDTRTVRTAAKKINRQSKRKK